MQHAAFITFSPFGSCIHSACVASPRFCASRRCVTRACTTPPHTQPRRTAALSTLAATSVLAAATGGPSLTAWSAMFGFVGVVTDAPVGLIGVAAIICAGISDLIAIDIGRSAFDTGGIPFLVFAVGCTVAGFLEIADGPSENVMPEAERPLETDRSRDSEQDEDRDLTAWDKELEKRDVTGSS